MFLGVDPSLRSAGLALVYGVNNCEVHLVKPPKGCTGSARLKYHRDSLREFVHGRVLTGAAVEGPSLGSVSRQDDLGQARGTYLLAIEDLGVTATVVAPTSLKKFGGGSGGAPKEKMVSTAQEHWPGVIFLTDDLADAAWLAEFAKALAEKPTSLKRHQIEALFGGRSKAKKTSTLFKAKQPINV